MWKATIVIEDKQTRADTLERLLEERTEQLALAEGDLRRLAGTDEVTGLPNYARFYEFLCVEWRRALRHASDVSLVRISLDDFAGYNEEFGRRGGDACLRRVAELLQSLVRRPGDLVARHVAAEFILALGRTPEPGAVHVARQIRAALAAAAIPHPRSLVAEHVTISVGVAAARPFHDSLWEELELIAAAGRALAAARRGGSDRIAVARPNVPYAVMLAPAE